MLLHRLHGASLILYSEVDLAGVFVLGEFVDLSALDEFEHLPLGAFDRAEVVVRTVEVVHQIIALEVVGHLQVLVGNLQLLIGVLEVVVGLSEELTCGLEFPIEAEEGDDDQRHAQRDHADRAVRAQHVERIVFGHES